MDDSPLNDEKTTLRDLRASPVHELSPGTVLAGRYRIIGAAGAGGMGAVYEAEQLELRRRVAIKLVLQEAGDSFERLRQEALGASAVQSAHVVSVFDFHWEEGEPPFLVMELLSGRSLKDLMGEGPLPWRSACRLACQLLDGLGAAHRVGIVHRDVTPANVWLVPSLTGELAKLVDFGLAKGLDDRMDLTVRSGRLIGTRDYLAPEQINRLPADPRSDLHAVGVLLWEMIAGRRIWKSEGPAVIKEILAHTPERLSAVVPDVPKGLADAVARALAKDTEGRFRDAAEMHAALAPYASEAPPPATSLESQQPITPTLGGPTPATPTHTSVMLAPLPPPPPRGPSAPDGDGTTKRSSGVEANPKLRPMPTPAMLPRPGSSGSHAAAASIPVWRSPAAWSPPSPPSIEAAPPAPSRARAWIILAVVVAIALAVPAGILAWVLHREASPPPPQPSRAALDAGATTTSSAARLGGSPSVGGDHRSPSEAP